MSIGCEAKSDLQRIAFLICRGGWPVVSELSEDVALNPAKDYYDAVVNVDIRQVDGVDRSVERAKTTYAFICKISRYTKHPSGKLLKT